MTDDEQPFEWPDGRPTDEELEAERLIQAEIERLSSLLAEEDAAQDELIRLELEYNSVHQAVADASVKLAEARAEVNRLRAAAERATAERAELAARVAESTKDDRERLDTALAELMRLSSGRYLADAEVEAARSEVEALREECAAQEAMCDELRAAIDAAKLRRHDLGTQRHEVEAAVAEEAARLGVALEVLDRMERERDSAERTSAEVATLAETAAILNAAAHITGEDLAKEKEERVLVGAGVGAAVGGGGPLDSVQRARWTANASWNAAFAVFSVLVALLGVKTLTSDPSATEAFCAESMKLDVPAAREAINALANGAGPGSAYSTFEQGRYAYTATSQVSAEVRAAAENLEAAHAAVAVRKGLDTAPAEFKQLGQAVFDADAKLRAACSPKDT